MTLSSAAYEAASSDEGSHYSKSLASHKAYSRNSHSCEVGTSSCNAAISAGNNNSRGSNKSDQKTKKKEKRFSRLLRRLLSKSKSKKNLEFDPESSAPAVWPSRKAGRRRSSVRSDESGHTWLTNGGESSSLAVQGSHPNKSGADGDRNQHNGEQLFQDSLGNLSVALPGLHLNHDSRSRLSGSDHASDGSQEVGTSSENDDDEMFQTAHGEINDMADQQDDMSPNEDITSSFLSCIAETPEGGRGISPPSIPTAQQDTAQEHEHEADDTASTTTQRRKSVEFKDVVSYATVANKKFLSDDELFVLFYSVEEETELRNALKSEIRSVKASPNPARTHPTFCRRGVEHYFLPRQGRQARLASQQNVLDAVQDEQYIQHCERGEIHDHAAIAIVSIEASRDARLDALERGGSDEIEAIRIRYEAAGTDMKRVDAVGISPSALNECTLDRSTLDDSFLKGQRRASNEGALCA